MSIKFIIINIIIINIITSIYIYIVKYLIIRELT